MQTAYDLLGADAIDAIARRFYVVMAEEAPALARLHPCDAQGRVSEEAQDKFALFLLGFLGGPMEYVAFHGHPDLPAKHAALPIDVAMRDAWLHCMRIALDESGLDGAVREELDSRFARVAERLRNR